MTTTLIFFSVGKINTYMKKNEEISENSLESVALETIKHSRSYEDSLYELLAEICDEDMLCEANKLGSSLSVKAIALFLIAKVRSKQNSVKSESDMATKLDLLAEQATFAAGLSTLSLVFDLKDKSILRKIRSSK